MRLMAARPRAAEFAALRWHAEPRLRPLSMEMAMNAIRIVTRVGPSRLSSVVVALLIWYACSGPNEMAPAAYPTVDASFLAAVEWRFVGPYRGGRVVAVAVVPNSS